MTKPKMMPLDPPDGAKSPAWRQRAVSKSLSAARERAEQRVQRFMDAAFELIDEKGSTEFTIQEVIDRSGQSLRGFYQYFEGKDELLLALFEETLRESAEDLSAAVAEHSGPIERLRAFTIRLHEWCEPIDTPRKHGKHIRRPVSEFSIQLAANHPDRVAAAMAPVSRILVELLEAAANAGAIHCSDPRQTAVIVLQLVMYSWFGNRFVSNPQARVSAEATWEFCLSGLLGTFAGRGPVR